MDWWAILWLSCLLIVVALLADLVCTHRKQAGGLPADNVAPEQVPSHRDRVS